MALPMAESGADPVLAFEDLFQRLEAEEPEQSVVFFVLIRPSMVLYLAEVSDAGAAEQAATAQRSLWRNHPFGMADQRQQQPAKSQGCRKLPQKCASSENQCAAGGGVAIAQSRAA